jgi:hypothetical protein
MRRYWLGLAVLELRNALAACMVVAVVTHVAVELAAVAKTLARWAVEDGTAWWDIRDLVVHAIPMIAKTDEVLEIGIHAFISERAGVHLGRCGSVLAGCALDPWSI